MTKVFTFGAPGLIGGASTELLHTIALWRANGVEVECIPTWGSVCPQVGERLSSIGVRVHSTWEDIFPSIPGLAGSIVVSFCNADFLKHYGKLREMGCKLVWCNSMTWAFHQELIDFSHFGPPEAVMFQSEYQRAKLEAKYIEHKYDPKTGHLIRGAFDITGWDFAPTPHATASPFILGKLARKDLDKWSSNLWSIYGRVQYPQRKALVMGMDQQIAKKLGNLPHWAEWLAPSAIPAQDYYRRIHCLLTVNGGAAENWPRIGLEAFACGVPVVAQREWGWIEMVRHGETGFLGSCDEELAHYAAMLAWDEPLRLRVVRNARERLLDELANPRVIWAGWERLFESVVEGRRLAA